MNFYVAADTDIGNVKDTNQDSLSLKVINSPIGKIAFAVLCDGMGGLSKGEVASATVIRAFDRWVKEQFPKECCNSIDSEQIRNDWENIVKEQNNALHRYGAQYGVSLGTTAVVLLIYEGKYLCMNVGDSRAYLLKDSLSQITKDQTFVEREVDMGRMTREEAMKDARRSVLLQCIGASDVVYPAFTYGDVVPGDSFLLSCDGFIHEITSEEIFEVLNSNNNNDENTMRNNIRSLIDLNKSRQERDNISAILVRTF